MVGELAAQPLVELIREIRHGGLSGALRLSRQPAKIAIYFDSGQVVFAASNLRKHRLREALKQKGITDEQLAEFPNANSDEDLARAVLGRRLVTPAGLQEARTALVEDALRVALLWPDGNWAFDQRVRVAGELKLKVATEQLLLECARHLPFRLIKSRLENLAGTYSAEAGPSGFNLLPAEELILSRATAAKKQLALRDLSGNGVTEDQALRVVYGLSLSGALIRSSWPPVLNPTEAAPGTTSAQPEAVDTSEQPPSDQPDVQHFLGRLSEARDYYEILDLGRSADLEQIKESYHSLARAFHPDRFHQGTPELRKEVESAFARVAQAYETLSDPQRRKGYDLKTFGKPGKGMSQPGPNGRSVRSNDPRRIRAETCFSEGVSALKRNQNDEAIRLLGEAATLEPREARYRAYYGSALTRRSTSRRAAETELQAALSLDPDNPTFRFMLAEFYQAIGLRRRAQTELSRVLAVDPRNEAARNLMATLSKA
jgi:curved DNA-binding protein CbpA